METTRNPHLKWRKSSRSNATNCVEVADLPDGGKAVRDSKNRSGPALTFTRDEWGAFVAGAQAGEFNL